jgi:DNA-3-methyladenine glycosylase
MRLKRKFFNRSTIKVAQELLGNLLVRKIGPSTSSGQAKIIKVRITETEAYCGTRDQASHASKGLTERTKVMFGPAGFSYVYMIYGMYHCFNIVTEKEGNPSAVLIRGVELCQGPGKLCRELKIDRKLNGIDLTKSGLLWIEEDETKIKKSQIKKGKRIGVDYAGKWKDKPWRFYI